MGVDDDFGGIGATTFALMRARMVAHDADAKLFEATLAQAVTAGIFKGPLTAIIDSSPVHGAGNVADTSELVRKMMGKVARAMGDHLDADLRSEAETLAAAKPISTGRTPLAARLTWPTWSNWPKSCCSRPGRARWPTIPPWSGPPICWPKS